ncbi:hypothetical protein J2S44_000888 [Catenuloplanes niger]|uniref:Uncharacterized protein n=1 Tax=Catenuloplanes niger TaxID=587534 RepID=A0AAE4CRY9_9ACTN|nr:hypothetical protein [Catenuloplanes niger]
MALTAPRTAAARLVRRPGHGDLIDSWGADIDLISSYAVD